MAKMINEKSPKRPSMFLSKLEAFTPYWIAICATWRSQVFTHFQEPVSAPAAANGSGDAQRRKEGGGRPAPWSWRRGARLRRGGGVGRACSA